MPCPARIVAVDGKKVTNKQQISATLGTAGTIVEFVFLANQPTESI